MSVNTTVKIKITSFLQMNGEKTLGQIFEYLKENYKDKEGEPHYKKKLGLIKMLNTMIDKEIEKDDTKKPYTVYRLKINPYVIAQNDGLIFRFNMNQITEPKIFGNILDEISKSRKKSKEPLQDMTQTFIEFLGMYLYFILNRSFDVPKDIEGKDIDKDKYNKLRTLWLSKALSLEEGLYESKMSSLFDHFLYEIALRIRNKNKKTRITEIDSKSWSQARYILQSSFEELYPQTMNYLYEIQKSSVHNLKSMIELNKEQPEQNYYLNDVLSHTRNEPIKRSNIKKQTIS